eukprot:4346707-Karenia_brevis.AAC.1
MLAKHGPDLVKMGKDEACEPSGADDGLFRALMPPLPHWIPPRPRANRVSLSSSTSSSDDSLSSSSSSTYESTLSSLNVDDVRQDAV